MIRILLSFLVVALLSSSVLSVSCTCSKEELAKFPYGKVVYWNAKHDIEQLPKDERNNRVDYEKAKEIMDAGGTLYLPVT